MKLFTTVCGAVAQVPTQLCAVACIVMAQKAKIKAIIFFIFLLFLSSIKVGAAGVKGAGIVMSTVLLEAIGMPLTVIPIFAAIWPAIDPPHTLLNNVSDIVGTSVIAKRLGLMDEKIYNSDIED